jgi:hypothetical protein
VRVSRRTRFGFDSAPTRSTIQPQNHKSGKEINYDWLVLFQQTQLKNSNKVKCTKSCIRKDCP